MDLHENVLRKHCRSSSAFWWLGIVAKNSILLSDFALGEIDRGVDPFVAIVDAGHKRAQPIVMITVAMVAGMVTMAFVARL